MRKDQTIQDQTEKDFVIGTKAPAHMLPARTASHDTPCITSKPSKFLGGRTEFQATICATETTEVKLDAVGIGKAVVVASGDGYAFLVMRDYLSADATTKSFFRQGDRQLVDVFEQLSAAIVIGCVEGPKDRVSA
jgi:hypothetical protein